MTDIKFLQLVKKMRENQVMYDRTKHSIYYEQKSKLEREVDSLIKSTEVKRQKEREKEFDFKDSLDFEVI